MYRFLNHHREGLIARCARKVAQRQSRAATAEQIANGVPLFLDQLTRTLMAEERGEAVESLRISGASGGGGATLAEIGVSAAAHGKDLLSLGLSVDQVVHDYGDLCQAITDLAFERDEPFSVDEFRTLNRCLDNAIADAVTAFSAQRDLEAAALAGRQSAEVNERLGFLVHELRNHLNSATLAMAALEAGSLTIVGATGDVLKRSLVAMAALLHRALGDMRVAGPPSRTKQLFSVATLIKEAQTVVSLTEAARGCPFEVSAVDPLLAIEGNRELLLAALMNLLQNAFKFTHGHGPVALRAYASDDDRIAIDVSDHCGGLPPHMVDQVFKPFVQAGHDRSGLGLGLTIARQSVEADGGMLTVRNAPGSGCTFTISLPRHALPAVRHPPQ